MEESLSLPEFDPSCMTICDYFKKGMGNPRKSLRKNAGAISPKRRAANDVEMLTR